MDFSKLQEGQAYMVQAQAKRGGFLPAILWKDDKDSRYLAFLTPIEKVPRLAVHFIKAPNGWREFVCRKNQIFEDESDGHCPLCDTFNNKPAIKHVAIAAELNPLEERVNGRKQVTGFELAMDEYETKDGETKTSPAIGRVSQAYSNFWQPFQVSIARKGDLTENVFEVVRSGKKQSGRGKGGNKVTYSFFDYEGREAVDEQLAEFEPEGGWITYLHSWIEEKGNAAYYADELEGYKVSDDDEEPSEEEQEAAAGSDSRFEALKADLEKREKQAEKQPEEEPVSA